MSILSVLTATEVINTYNVFAKQNGSQTVKKFRDKKTGESRLQDISRGLERKVVAAALKKAGVPATKIKLLPEEPKTLAVPEAPAPVDTPSAPPVKHVDAKKVLAEAKKVEEARQQRDEEKQKKAAAKEIKLNEGCTEVLAALQEEVPSKDTEIDSTQLAKKLKTSTTAVIKAAQVLSKLGLVKVEDDSPDDAHPLVYLSLTTAGRATAVTPKRTTTPAKEGKQPKKALPGERPGPVSNKSSKKLYKLVDGNPRREGTHGWKSFSLIKDGMTYEQYKAAGGRNNDLAWDIDHSYVELR